MYLLFSTIDGEKMCSLFLVVLLSAAFLFTVIVTNN